MKKMMFKIVAVAEASSQPNIPESIRSILISLKNNSLTKNFNDLERTIESVFCLKGLNIQKAESYVTCVLNLKGKVNNQKCDFGLNRMKLLISYLDILNTEVCKRDKILVDFRKCVNSFGLVLSNFVPNEFVVLFQSAIADTPDSGCPPSPVFPLYQYDSCIKGAFEITFPEILMQLPLSVINMIRDLTTQDQDVYSDSVLAKIKRHVVSLCYQHTPVGAESFILHVLGKESGLREADKVNVLGYAVLKNWIFWNKVKTSLCEKPEKLEELRMKFQELVSPKLNAPVRSSSPASPASPASPPREKVTPLYCSPISMYSNCSPAPDPASASAPVKEIALKDEPSSASVPFDLRLETQELEKKIRIMFSATDKNQKRQDILFDLKKNVKVPVIVAHLLKNNWRLFLGHSKFKAELRAICAPKISAFSSAPGFWGDVPNFMMW